MSPPPLARALTTLLLGLGLPACAGARDQSTYASCLREPRAYGDGATRYGHVTAYRIESDDYYHGDGSPERMFRTSITRADCKDSLVVSGPGVDFRGGPWQPLSEGGFAANYRTNRLAFAYHVDEHVAHVWIDGVARGPYHGLSLFPRFSENGRHVAYQVHESDGTFTLYADDRKITKHPRLSDWPFLYVLDDGKVAAPSYEADQKIRVIVGDYRSAPLDELCSNWGFQPGPNGHWGFTARLGTRWITVIDGVTVEVSGIPSRCEIEFSEDGSRSGYVVTPVAGDPASKRGVVLDRAYHPELELATEIVFQGSIPVATVEDKRFPGGQARVLHLVGLPTPPVAPSPDDASPRPAEGQTPWVRVNIGDSVGPRLDKIDMTSLTVDAEGRVHYRGERADAPVTLIDNVIQERPARAAVAQ